MAGVVLTGVYSLKVLPLILEAETYEQAAAAAEETAQEDEGWAPAEGLERLAFTLLTNVLVGVGFALVLCAAFALRGVPRVSEGLLWGLAGFAAFSLAPALGLPPELPGMRAADLDLRQAWWAGTVAATAAGLALLFLNPRRALKALGLALLVLPHVIGAPHEEVSGLGALPAELAAQFVTATLGANLVFWLVLGGLSALALGRFTGASGARPRAGSAGAT